MAAPRERMAVIDLGPDPATPAMRIHLGKTLVAAGFEAVAGDGVEDALAGIALDRDAAALAMNLADAQRAFGALDCKATNAAALQVAGIGAARQAAGLPVPELPRAWALILLCADRSGTADVAMRAAALLRTLGGSPDVPADVLAKYPDVDAMVDRELVTLEITADVPGATIWIDYVRAGSAPLTVHLTAGEHVIAAAAGARRGWASGAAVRSQKQLAIPTTEHGSTRDALARRVASWNGMRPAPAELGAVMAQVKARLAIVRRGDRLEIWGRPGLAQPPRVLGGEDGAGTVDDLDRLLALAADRARAWNDRAPDPDQPLLVEDRTASAALLRESARDRDPPTKWWVYASVIGAVVGGAALVYGLDRGTDRQRVELVYP